ncbi:ABC transporter substrate-binding protein [Bradyrhizobium tropiciagri]|uniref:ABC transporter substrate-binding protein n=1 Tax=Bradyrhizobium tropiciagri TaxID=312253 RepID=UPI00067D76F1|nr:ABC transporter substrate-binding protein [Bradyrhizobium tropiciagri]
MKRRRFITLVGGAAASWPLTALAQQASTRVYRLGYLAPAHISHLVDALFGALRDLGYVEGQNLKVEYRYGTGKELDELAAELAKGKPDVIVTVATPPALAAKRATTTIPIVMATAGAPVSLGVVASLARPGGNVTGVTLYGSELNAKRIEIFREAVPTIKQLAFLANAKNTYSRFLWGEAEPASLRIELKPVLYELQELSDLPATFLDMDHKQIDGVIVFSDALFNNARRQITALAAEHHLPAMYEAREFVDEGGLISYGPDIEEMTRRSAIYVDKVLKGADPSTLPIEQPTRFELAINAKSAKALGLSLSPTLLARADEVIE